MKVNRYAARCSVCSNVVNENAGELQWSGRRWEVKHLACAASDTPSVIEIRTSGGTFTRNARGTCEDAPCCGCCTV